MNKIFAGKKTFFIFLMIFTACFNLFAERSVITFNADSVTASVSKNKKSTNLIGNASVSVDSLTIKADKIEIFGDEYRFVNATGSVTGEDKKNGYSFNADLIKFDRKEDVVFMFGKTELKDTKNDVNINAENIEYDKTSEIMIMRFNIKIINKDIECNASTASYNRKNSTLELSGLPIVKKKKDEFKAAKISVNLDTEEIILDGRVSGKVQDEKQDKDSPDKKDNNDSQLNDEDKKPEDSSENEDKNTDKKDDGETSDANTEKKDRQEQKIDFDEK